MQVPLWSWQRETAQTYLRDDQFMRFGLFNQGKSEPIEEYVGDSIQMIQPQVIEVIREGGFHDMPTAVAYIHLGRKQSVREIEAAPIPVRDRRVPTAWPYGGKR